MKHFCLFLILSLPLATIAESPAPFPLIPGTTVHWATPSEGRELMSRSDTFTRQLSAFDRGVRLKQKEAPSPEAFLDFVSEQTLEWTEVEIARFRDSLERIQPRLAQWDLPLPEKVLLIKTTGKDEPAPYTRQNAIILPKMVTSSARKPDSLLAHELFHVLSRNATEDFRTALYSVLGFKACGQIDLPDDLAPRRITNPDSPLYTHYIQVTHRGEERDVVPILLSRTSSFDPESAKPFFSYLEQRLMVIEERSGHWSAVMKNEKTSLLGRDEVERFYEQIGGRKYSIFQPEEILAGHFTSLVMKVNLPADEGVQSKLNRVLLEKKD